PRRAVVLVGREDAWDTVRAPLDDKGRFEVHGLSQGPISVCVHFPEHRNYTPPGYRVSGQNKCRDPLNPWRLVGQLDRDITDLTMLFEPGEAPRSSLDPGQLADFKEAQAGPITGVSPLGDRAK